MLVAGTFNFFDHGNNDEACVIVRYDESTVGLVLSLKRDGDIVVFMSKDDARKIIEALNLATS